MHFWKNVEYQLVGQVEVDVGEMVAMMDQGIDVD
jgi:hypothetical protein